MRTLLLIVTLVSNLPLLIVGMGALLLIVLVILICRSRQKKVSRRPPHSAHVFYTRVFLPLTLHTCFKPGFCLIHTYRVHHHGHIHISHFLFLELHEYVN